MNAVLIFVNEALPDEYPATPEGLSDAATAINADMVWQRIESYVCTRYTERAVEFIVEGPGDWRPPLKPVTLATVEEWRGETWVNTTLAPSPLGGFILKGCGPYRFTGIAGEDDADIPATVTEAFRRIIEYMAGIDESDRPGARSVTEAVPDVHSTTIERSPTWMAQALQNSGAADLLRNLRRA
ncbi:hypothetical protein [Reyranella sp.]|uniref:hypothetical protein n=1 Tax=Reyranella sp. TaxID=1929291 RepID=UPI003782FD2A